jgi:hypothetical protein
VDACRVAEQVARSDLDAARAMQQRVREAEQAARAGLAVIEQKVQPGVD